MGLPFKFQGGNDLEKEVLNDKLEFPAMRPAINRFHLNVPKLQRSCSQSYHMPDEETP